jgi:hypothetical protein
MGVKKVKSRKRVYGLFAVTLVICVGLSVFLSLNFSAITSVQAQKSGGQPEAADQVAEGNLGDDGVTSDSSAPARGSPNNLSTISNLVNFTCNADSSYAFAVTVEIDLSDGMNSTEAEIVARAIFEHELDAVYVVKSAEVDGSGVWTVNLSWEYDVPNVEQEALTHFFDVAINPFDQTATYSRCY